MVVNRDRNLNLEENGFMILIAEESQTISIDTLYQYLWNINMVKAPKISIINTTELVK